VTARALAEGVRAVGRNDERADKPNAGGENGESCVVSHQKGQPINANRLHTIIQSEIWRCKPSRTRLIAWFLIAEALL
jgi:hypothetical protein